MGNANNLKSKTVTFDKYGRMQYHPDFHANHKKPWKTSEQKFLIDNYEKIGPEETSLALERTIHTVMTKATKLRKQGIMPDRTSRKSHTRMLRPEGK